MSLPGPNVVNFDDKLTSVGSDFRLLFVCPKGSESHAPCDYHTPYGSCEPFDWSCMLLCSTATTVNKQFSIQILIYGRGFLPNLYLKNDAGTGVCRTLYGNCVIHIRFIVNCNTPLVANRYECGYKLIINKQLMSKRRRHLMTLLNRSTRIS